MSLICASQVKPLLQVTRQDEEIQARESQLLKAKENLNQVEQNYTDLERKHVQVNMAAALILLPLPPSAVAHHWGSYRRSCWRRSRCWLISCRRKRSC